MGAFRLLLSLLVLLSHTGVAISDHNIGVVAVVSFFLMSGFVMTALVEKYYMGLNYLPMFALDRGLRLFPQFLFYLVVAFLLAKILALHEPYMSGINAWTALLNAAMLPLGYYEYLLPNALILPQTWTLGLEFTFYAVFPFLLIYRVRGLACVSSMLIFGLAISGILDPEDFAYRLLPGTLFIFLCGSYIKAGAKIPTLAIWLSCVAALTIFLYTHNGQRVGYNIEVLSGIVGGVPIVWLLSKRPFHWIDETLGNMSYGVYLNELMSILVFARRGLIPGRSVETPPRMVAQIPPPCAAGLMVLFSCFSISAQAFQRLP
jgi:peptidoglycan/LPS O-acetylase OafA/YrhL